MLFIEKRLAAKGAKVRILRHRLVQTSTASIAVTYAV